MSVQWLSRLALVAALALPTPNGGASERLGEAKADRLDRTLTASLPRPERFAADLGARNLEELKRGLDALASGDVSTARDMRDGLPRASVDWRILEWAIVMRGGAAVRSDEIADAARDLADWPGAEALRRSSERALLREKPAPQIVLDAFADAPPQTVAGTILLARTHIGLGDQEAARKVLGPFWRTAKLDGPDEARILKEFGGLIAKSDHRFRMERMLYAERIKSAERMAPLAQAEPLLKAWSAVIRGDKNALKLLSAVPANQRSAGFLFAEAKQLRRHGKFVTAAAIMAKAPRTAEALVDPDAWWVERRVLSRELMDEGDMKLAYQVAAAHAAEAPNHAVDAEFHAGWYALRGLNDPVTAARHFARIAEVADGPISSARAYYWLGRAAEASGQGDAKAYYAKAAVFGTAFYGQLAAQKISLSSITVPTPEPSLAERANFARREPVLAMARLEEAGHSELSERLYRELAGQLTSPGELALLAARAQDRGNYFLALKIAKAAANRGINIGGLAHPVGAIPTSAAIGSAGTALAYAIARQESEFNVGAVSPAGARGMLQLLPGTAKDVAKRTGLAYSLSRLTTDAGYNATLGAAFLGQQLERFKGSYILTFAGYNAGPRRALEWIERYGDPRGKEIDAVVDWIERIPFTETRSYVQRVMENYQVYKMRLTGTFDIAGDLVNGRN